MKIDISYGILAPSIEEQLKERGFTLSSNESEGGPTKCQVMQRARESVNILRMNSFLTEGESNKVFQRMQKYLVKHLRKLPKEKHHD